jgi:hypothetical protein
VVMENEHCIRDTLMIDTARLGAQAEAGALPRRRHQAKPKSMRFQPAVSCTCKRRCTRSTPAAEWRKRERTTKLRNAVA